MWDTISQIGIATLGIAAVLLVAKKNKWGFVVGFLSQPFWLITSFINKQWGVFILSIIYVGSWILGIYEWFFKKKDIINHVYPGSSQDLNKTTENSVYFYTPKFYIFDNFSAHTINIWGIKFPTAEHAYQWKKFSDSTPSIANEIIKADSPSAVKKISNNHKNEASTKWDEERVLVMEQILRAKAEQHEDVRDKLRKTGQKIIIENSPTDDFWGIGANNKGKNMVGVIWMKIRDSLDK